MNVKKLIKESFVVIGKEGSTDDGDGFVGKLWEDANAHFGEIEAIVKKDETGRPFGIWGAMSDFSLSFSPWEDNFSKGLYLAGAECEKEAIPPDGWTKWCIPSFEYVYIENDGMTAFSDGISYLKEQNITLAGAVQEFHCPKTGKGYLYFPIRKI